METIEQTDTVELRSALDALCIAVREKCPTLMKACINFQQALAFGDVAGFPGWTNVANAWSEVQSAGLPPKEQLLLSTMKDIVRTYLAYLRGIAIPDTVYTLIRAVHGILDLLSVPDSLKPNLKEENLVKEMNRHADAVPRTPGATGLQNWYSTWARNVASTLTAFEQGDEPNVLDDLVRVTFDDCYFPVVSQMTEDVGRYFGYARSVQALVGKYLSGRNCRIIEPIQGERADINDHEFEPGNGTSIISVKARGYHWITKQAKKKAKVVVGTLATPAPGGDSLGSADNDYTVPRNR